MVIAGPSIVDSVCGEPVAHELDRTRALHAGALVVARLEGHVDDAGAGARQITADGLGAVHEPHRAGGARTLPLRDDDEA